MSYDSTCKYSRQNLAISLTAKLESAGFARSNLRNTREWVYDRPIEGTNLRIRVYTSVVQNRELGLSVHKDVIRVHVVSPDMPRPMFAEARVDKTGDVKSICDHTIERAREAYVAGKKSGKCHKCGSPKAFSKKGNWYCAKICWKSPEEKAQDRQLWLKKTKINKAQFRGKRSSA